ncbi:MAG TPA: DUF1127 domain-containing protein [Arenicellales bacterium]|nr:DUF1127 domain-containing protein [Arenicellales bacterium]
MTTCDMVEQGGCRGVVRPGRRGVWIRRLLHWLAARHQQRELARELATMPDYLLRDMGVSREDLQRELERRWWQS